MTTIPVGFWDNEKRRLLAVLLPKLSDIALQGVLGAMRKAGIAFNLELSNLAAARWARQYTDDLLEQLGTTSERLVGEALGKWIERPGATMGDLVELLTPKFAENVARADLIAVTEVTRAYASGEEAAYLANGIERWRWNTNRDELVCRYCRPINGKVVRIGEPFGEFRGEPVTKPPFHPGCRCWVSPVVGKRGSQDRSRWAEMQRILAEEMRQNVLGFTYNQDMIASVGQAIAAGNSEDGWKKHERIFLDEYLSRFKLQDEIEWTIGLWNTPEPSFNTWLRGELGEIEALAKVWGKDYNQQAMALLLPSKGGAGGKLVWEFERELTADELDRLLLKMVDVNRELTSNALKLGVGDGFQIGLTVRGFQKLEFWFTNENEAFVGERSIEKAIRQASLPGYNLISRLGYIFRLLFLGSDY